MENLFLLKVLRIISLSMSIIGIMGSLVLMAHAGRHNQSVLLILLFTGWVSSPFLALLITYFSNFWPDSRRVHLYILMISHYSTWFKASKSKGFNKFFQRDSMLESK